MKTLTRYWVTFSKSPAPSPLNIGCGVTAFGFEDALQLMKERFGPDSLKLVVRYVEDIDVSTLDPGHVLPNMGVASNRGIWFPLP
jgi:hypothetical protein